MTGRTEPGAGWIDLCLPLTKISESCRLQSYADPEPDGIRWTIGWGATGPGVGPDTVWTQAQADADLMRRLGKLGEWVSATVKCPLTNYQKAALVDFVYNIGRGAFRQSTMLALLNRHEVSEAAEEFSRWVYDDGEVLGGLEVRRRRERNLFNTGTWV